MSCLVGMRSHRPLTYKEILRGGRPQGILAWQTDGEIVDGLFLSPPPLWDLLLVTPSRRRDTGQVWLADELRERTIVQRSNKREDGDMLEGTDCTSYGGVIFKSNEVFAGDRSVGVNNAEVVELGDTSGEPDEFAVSLFNTLAGC